MASAGEQKNKIELAIKNRFCLSVPSLNDFSQAIVAFFREAGVALMFFAYFLSSRTKSESGLGEAPILNVLKIQRS